jgi:Tfp pilus assembly protein PilO
MSRNYLEAFAITILAAGFGFFLTWPKYVELRDIEQKIAKKITEIKNRQDYYDNLERISVQLGDYKDSLAKISSAFPENADSPALMNFIQATAMQSGLVLKSVKYSGAEALPGVKAAVKKSGGAAQSGEATVRHALQKYKVNASLMGSYADFKNFLSRIEGSSRMIELGQIEVDSQEAATPKDAQKTSADIVEDDGKGANQILNYEISVLANYYE